MADSGYGKLPDISPHFITDPVGFLPYSRDKETLARPWAIPGTPGLEHRIGGLEKKNLTGNIDYSPKNHDLMVHLRAEKIARVANDIPMAEIEMPSKAMYWWLAGEETYGAIQDRGAASHPFSGGDLLAMSLRKVGN